MRKERPLSHSAIAMHWDGCFPVAPPPGTPYSCTVCDKYLQIGGVQCTITHIYCDDGFVNTVADCW